jgi:N-alpha-acetyl-L-2,4-diaminobutyrate deacetylase
MSRPSKVSLSLDPERSGKQIGYLSAPHSRNESGWGAARFPVAVVKNGRGPTVFLTGGNHGDEYEGPIALAKLVHAIDPAEIQGRIIAMPYLNYPAVCAGTRLSPIDGVNMNRAFPGERDGTVTRMIADFIYRHILPLADAALDIHSGGKTMYFDPFGAVHELEDRALAERAWQALLAFAPPIALRLRELDAEGMLDTAVEGLGKVFVTTELGGGGTTRTGTIAIAESGIRNFLRHFAILEGKPETRESRGLAPTRRMAMPPDAYVIAEDRGLLEMRADLGADVKAGQEIAAVHDLDRLGAAPKIYRAPTEGVLIGRIHGCMVAPGDFVAMLARDVA